MSIIEHALVQWRRSRRNVSDHRETNIAAWLVALQSVLAEHGLTDSQFSTYLGDDPRSFVEKEYAETGNKPG